MGKCIHYASINTLIRLINQINQDLNISKFISFKILFSQADWKHHIEVAKKDGLIIQDKDNPYTAFTLSGANLLEVCVNNDKFDKEWILKGAF